MHSRWKKTMNAIICEMRAMLDEMKIPCATHALNTRWRRRGTVRVTVGPADDSPDVTSDPTCTPHSLVLSTHHRPPNTGS